MLFKHFPLRWFPWLFGARFLARLGRILSSKRWYIAFLFLSFVYQVGRFRHSDWFLEWRLGQTVPEYAPHIDYERGGYRPIRYLELGNASEQAPLVVLIHGSPSSLSIWLPYLEDPELLASARLLAMDRPGYGYSDFGRCETSVERQAASIIPLLRSRRARHQHIVLVGTSYGGTVAARIAMDCPECADGLIFQSSSLAPGQETIYWISYPTTHWALRWLMPGTVDVANHEKLAHTEQLLAMEPLWGQLCQPVMFLHGTADELIHPSNPVFAQNRLVHSPKIRIEWVPGHGHTLAFTAPERLKACVQDMLYWLENERFEDCKKE